MWVSRSRSKGRPATRGKAKPPRPQPPLWALIHGLPPPHPGEEFVAYCLRLGISRRTTKGFLKGLNEVTMPVANERLHTHLIRECPGCFMRWVTRIRNKHDPDILRGVSAARPKRVRIIVTHVPGSIRDAVDGYARTHGISRNQMVLETLLADYDLKPVEPSPSSSYRVPNLDREGPWSLEVIEPVRKKLRLESARKGATISGLVKGILASRFGLDPIDPSRRQRAREGIR